MIRLIIWFEGARRDTHHRMRRRSNSNKDGEYMGPPWADCDYEDMDDKFVRAMRAAGFRVTECSTKPGTRAPVAGYRSDGPTLP